MKKTALALLLLVGCATSQTPAPEAAPAAAPAPAPAKPPPPPVVHAPKAPVPIAEYFKVRRQRGATFSFDDSVVVYSSDEGGRLDLWAQPVAGGAAVQITHSTGFLAGFEFSPKKDQLIVGMDEGGTELPRLYLTDSKGTAPVALFPNEPKTARQEFVDWAGDGKTLLYRSSARDEKYLDLLEYDLATKKSTPVWQPAKTLDLAVVSRDHKQFVLIDTISDADSNLYLFKRGAKEPVLLTPHTGEVLYGATGFSPDGKTLFYLSDVGGEFTSLYAMDLATKKSTPVLAEKWDVENADFSLSGKMFFTQTNEDGAPKLVITDPKTKKPVALPALPGPVQFQAFSKTDRYLVTRLQTDDAPAQLLLIDLKAGTSRALVDPLPETLKGRKFVKATSVRIPSFDGKEVPAFLYSPEGPGPFPAVIDVHGGPTAQSQRVFSVYEQYFVSKGYVVLVPNVRGSTGYGKTYTRLDNLDLGGGPLKDVVACKAWLAANAKVDPKKVTIMGGSYGGYMTLAAATFTPTEFAAHVDIFGVSDLKTLVESFPPYWATAATYIFQKFGDPKNPAHAQYQHDRSPIHYVDQIVRPLLVIQGTNDARVKKDQSDRVVEALKKRNVPVDYLVIEGEGHGFSKTENFQAALETVDRFLDKHIFGDTEVKVIK